MQNSILQPLSSGIGGGCFETYLETMVIRKGLFIN